MIRIVAAPRLTALLAEQFEALGGFDVQPVENGEAALAAPWPDAFLLDAEACDAATLAGRLRESGFGDAILTISTGACPNADAVVKRPFRFSDLVASLESARAAREENAGFGARLTEKEAAILERLARAEGAVIPKAALLAEVWGYGPNVSTRTLETHICRLRRKIEADPSRPRRLLTEGGGYRLARPRAPD